jgi:hypothetical protein
MIKWEYKTVKINSGNFSQESFELTVVDDFVNQFGELGWELVSTLLLALPGEFSFNVVLFFKRPISE